MSSVLRAFKLKPHISPSLELELAEHDLTDPRCYLLLDTLSLYQPLAYYLRTEDITLTLGQDPAGLILVIYLFSK